ncbi:MAG: hypothetical protein ACREOF_13590 [Gemmatimonadales bacterium]
MNRRDFNRSLLAPLGAAMLPIPPLDAAVAPLPTADPEINPAGLMEQLLRQLAEFGRNPEGGVSRVAYSEADRQGREYVTGLMREAELEVTVDAAGNLLGRRAGRDPRLPPLAFGSHVDSVPNGGNYDGPVGSLGAIEVARTLAENRIRLAGAGVRAELEQRALDGLLEGAFGDFGSHVRLPRWRTVGRFKICGGFSRIARMARAE